VKVGQRVQVTVQEVDLPLKRIALSMKSKVDLVRIKPGERRNEGNSHDVQRHSGGKNQPPQVDWFTAAMNKKN
jgi:transcriptional accessory protein Tex/SPT6